MSKPAISTYHRPNSLEEAWDLVSPGDPAVRLLSGGADLTIHAPDSITTLVDVGRILDSDISVEIDGTIRLGAMATLTDVMEHPAAVAHGTGVIPEMMVHVGNPLLRNFSTIGGHMARGKLSDVVPVFLALDSEISLFTGEHRSLSLAEYYDQSYHAHPHVVTELRLPPLPERSAAAFLRFAKTAFDFAILNVSCRVDLDGSEVKQARVICGSTPKRAHRAPGAEAILLDSGLTPETIEAAAAVARTEVRTGGGWVASAEYRSHLVEVLAKRCLTTVSQRLETL